MLERDSTQRLHNQRLKYASVTFCVPSAFQTCTFYGMNNTQQAKINFSDRERHFIHIIYLWEFE